MLCPKCNEVMALYGDPQISATPELIKGELFPKKLICSAVTIYACTKCTCKAAYTENKDYTPACCCDITGAGHCDEPGMPGVQGPKGE